MERAWRAGQPVADALNAAPRFGPARPASPWPCFVPAAALPTGEAYEAFIARTRSVPTRDNLHDFLNGLVWLHAPALKWAMNRLQAAEIAHAGVGPQRGRLRDALTLFDENGALLSAPQRLVERLAARDWHALFVSERTLWREARLQLIGHALIEKLVQPRKPITAHVLAVPQSGAVRDPDAADVLADTLQREPRPFLPLPVLGVPGWWSANESPAFYADAQVFRPATAQRPPQCAEQPKG
jgi:hypothetical protein